MAIQAGTNRGRAGDLATGLLDSLDEASPQAPGDQLLALGLFAEGEPSR
jgi:hypothetical protein